jgi:hypothetical protein
VGTLDFYRIAPPPTTILDLNGRWSAGVAPQPFIRVNDTGVTVDMSAFGRPPATGTITGRTTLTVTFPDVGVTTPGQVIGNQIRWSNGTVWTKVPPPTVFELNGKWTAGRGPGPFFRVNGSAITVDLSADRRPAATGSILNPTTIVLTFPDVGVTTTGQLVGPNTIHWSNNTQWMKL